MSALWNKSQLQARKGTDWKDVLPKSSTLQDLMTKVYNGAYINGELIVHVVGAELVQSSVPKGSGNPFCVVQLKSKDGEKAEAKQFKTAIIHKDINLSWNEAFIMELRSKSEVVLWIELRSSSMWKDKRLGKCVVTLDQLTDDAPLETQLPLLTDDDKPSIGTITVRMDYTSAIRRNLDYVIAVENYGLLSKMLLDKEGLLVGALCQVCKDDDLSMVVIRLFNSHGLACQLLSHLMASEIQTRGEPSTLFRTDSMATKTMRNYFQLISRKSYLNQQITPLIAEITAIVQKGGSFEVFPNMLKAGESIEENTHNLWNVTSNLIKRILSSFDSIPGNIKKFFGILAGMMEATYGSVMLHSAGSLFFLRFFCPGVVFPIESGIVQPDAVNPEIYRGLLLVGKLLQGITGRVEFREDALRPFNDLVSFFIDDMDNFLKLLCSPSNAGKEASILGPVDDPRHPYTNDELAKLVAIVLRKLNMNHERLAKIKYDDNTKNTKMKEMLNLLTAIFADTK